MSTRNLREGTELTGAHPRLHTDIQATQPETKQRKIERAETDRGPGGESMLDLKR